MSMRLDVVDLIMQDHREVERLFEQMQTDPGQRPLLLPVVTSLLIAHSRAEELHVYPAARDEAGEQEEVAHSQEEHQEAEQVLARLQGLEPDSSEFERLFNQLVEDVNHHVQEEEQTVLPGMRERLSEQRRHDLGQDFLQERSAQLGAQPGEETREELAQQAQNIGVTGASSMTKDEIAAKLHEQ